MINITQIMMALIKSAMDTNEDFSFSELSEESAKMLYKLSKSHDLTHLLTSPIEKHKVITNASYLSAFQKQTFMAVYRYEGIQYELDSLCGVLEAAQIPFIPLKGSILRAYYPEPWMRTSCDIDIFVEEKNLDSAIAVLKDKLQYTEHERCAHDVSLFSANGVHIELHYELIEDKRVNGASNILSNVWDYAKPVYGHCYQYKMSDEMFYFYHIAHMAKHFEIGGCGVRPFLDLWVLNHRVEYDSAKRDLLLEQGNLLIFANASKRLSEVWFGDEAHSEITLDMENYLIDAGVYGNSTNRVAVAYVKKGGKFKYLLSRIWLPYNRLKYVYPTLENKRMLTLFYQLKRWCNFFSKKKRRKLSREMKLASNQSSATVLQTEKLFSDLGIKIK